MRRRHHRFAIVFVAIAGLSACQRILPNDPNMVSTWMRTLYGAVRVERASAPVGSRIFAYAGIGLYAGMAAANPKLPSLAGRLNGFPALPPRAPGQSYDPTLTSIAAERVILDTLFREGLPTTVGSLNRLADSLVAARVADGVDHALEARSVDLGRRTGLAIVAWSRNDGFDTTRGRRYLAPTGPGLWVSDAPANTYATQNQSGASQSITIGNPTNAATGGVSDRSLILDRAKLAGSAKTIPAANMAGVTEPYWGHNRPFALTSWNECPAPMPPKFALTPGTPLYEEARQVYLVNQKLAPEQHTIALYWADNAGESGTPAGHWLSIASQMVSERHLSGEQAAWLMALTGVSLADAFIAAWGYKFQLNVIRPRTFIRATIDPNWEPAIPTPPFPEYLSGHSTVSAAAAATLTGVLGPVPFEDSTSVTIGHAVRKFASFRAAAYEAGMSRIYGGIHYPSANVAGGDLGRCISAKILARFNGGAMNWVP